VDDRYVRLVDTCEHVNDKLVDEPTFAVLKEVAELNLKVFEDCVHDFSLHLGRDLLIEVEFFDYQVEVMKECILHILLYLAVKVRRDVVGLIRALNFLDPDVKHAQLFVNKALKVIALLKHVVDAAHEEREETQANELKILTEKEIPQESCRRCVHSECFQCGHRNLLSSVFAG
jgi:hypothetical protein